MPAYEEFFTLRRSDKEYSVAIVSKALLPMMALQNDGGCGLFHFN